MKKGIILITLSLATLVSTFFVSGTYAKYTTTFSGSSSAEVAEWRFGMTNTVDLLDAIYDTQNEVFIPGEDPQNHVEDTDVANNKLAPGAYGEYSFTIAGTAETSYRLQFDFSGSIDNTNGRLNYCLDGLCVYKTLKELEDAINYNYTEHTFAPGQQPGYWVDNNPLAPLVHTIQVVWNYSDGEDADKLDTELGIRAANGEELEVKLVVKVDIIQID